MTALFVAACVGWILFVAWCERGSLGAVPPDIQRFHRRQRRDYERLGRDS